MQSARPQSADDVVGKGVDDERRVHGPGSGRHVGQIRHPQLIGARRRELALDAIGGMRGELGWK